MADDLDQEIDRLAYRIERSIQRGDEILAETPDFEYGRYLRQQTERAKQFFSEMPGVNVDVGT